MHCNATDCGHEATISTDRFPADLPFLDIALRVRCSACGAKPVGVMRDMLGVYARLHAKYSWGMSVSGPLPASYRVVGWDVPWPDEGGRTA
ncbi:hypothetical protein [Methylobacterium sp. WSM2598]|uniref:hypothetical protein n=1 Tax=Methylobacterium sp. WSM2598 TaxID=398261 RepID=UPI00036294DE|nr:hypothetical protein [Methylobacterium sp. WSM2598]